MYISWNFRLFSPQKNVIWRILKMIKQREESKFKTSRTLNLTFCKPTSAYKKMSARSFWKLSRDRAQSLCKASFTVFSYPGLDSPDQVRLCFNAVLCHHLACGKGSVKRLMWGQQRTSDLGGRGAGGPSWCTWQNWTWVRSQSKKVLSGERPFWRDKPINLWRSPLWKKGQFVLCDTQGSR